MASDPSSLTSCCSFRFPFPFTSHNLQYLQLPLTPHNEANVHLQKLTLTLPALTRLRRHTEAENHNSRVYGAPLRGPPRYHWIKGHFAKKKDTKSTKPFPLHNHSNKHHLNRLILPATPDIWPFLKSLFYSLTALLSVLLGTLSISVTVGIVYSFWGLIFVFLVLVIIFINRCPVLIIHFQVYCWL